MDYFLPRGYQARKNNDPYLDVPDGLIYQPHVYRLTHFLAERCGISSIIDIGCGSGGRLKIFNNEYKITCIDCAPALDLARRSIPHADFIEYDLEQGLPNLPEERLKKSIITCSDVIEHLKQPEPLMRALARLSRLAPYVLISTPDRDRARGWLNNGPPDNPAHTMEWNASEFVRFMKDSGFESVPFYGHTINTAVHQAKSIILTVTGTHLNRPFAVKNDFRVAAIIHTFNEADILPEVIEHLISQGIEVHVFDNWSSDGTWELINDFQKSGRGCMPNVFPVRIRVISSYNCNWKNRRNTRQLSRRTGSCTMTPMKSDTAPGTVCR